MFPKKIRKFQPTILQRLRDTSGKMTQERPRLVVSRSTCPPPSSLPPREQLCTRSCSNKTHTYRPGSPRWAGGWVLHQPPWSFGFDSQTRGTRENRAPPCVRVPGSSRVPAPPWVGSRSPDGWDQIPRWAGGWVLHQPPWSFGFDSQREEPGKPGAPCVIW